MEKLRLILKFMTSPTGKQIIAIPLHLNILKIKGNHLKMYNIRKAFLENPYKKPGGKASHRPFSKN